MGLFENDSRYTEDRGKGRCGEEQYVGKWDRIVKESGEEGDRQGRGKDNRQKPMHKRMYLSE